MLFRSHRMIYEASLASDSDMDTELINECVETLNTLQGEDAVEETKLNAMRHTVIKQYEAEEKLKKKRHILSRITRLAAAIIIAFCLTYTATSALGYNLFEIVVTWGEEKLSLGTRFNAKNGLDQTTAQSFQQLFNKDETTPLLPTWVPEGFTLVQTETFEQEGSFDVVLFFENEGKSLIFDIRMYENPAYISDANFEKDEKEVEIFKWKGQQIYLFSNLVQIQAVWNSSNILYAINGDIGVEDMKKIIRLMDGGN